MLNNKEKQKTVLFICVENSCRSQMAEGLFNNLTIDNTRAYSAGSKPLGEINVLAKEVMKEVGINISACLSKGVESLPIKEFDYIVGMGCNDRCSILPGYKYIEWQITDPKGKDIHFFKKTRKEIKGKVEELIREIERN